jgi:rhamnose transport system permease protein
VSPESPPGIAPPRNRPILLIHETREFVSWQWNRDELNFIVVGALLIVSVMLNAVLERKR